MASAAPSPSQRGIRFCVKNTFIDTVDDEQPVSLVRCRTEPLARKPSLETNEDHLSDVLSANSGSESWSDAGSDAQAEERLAEDVPVTLPIAGAKGSFQGSGLPLTVKNTFISLEERLDEESPTLCRCNTVPAMSGTSSLSGASFSVETGDSQASEGTSSRGFAAFTPTPWSMEVPEEQLCFWTPVPAEAPSSIPPAPKHPPVLALQPAQSSGSSAPATAPGTLAHPLMMQKLSGGQGKISISAKDKNLAISQLGSACRVQWTVDAKRLRGTDKQVVSPPLEVSLQPGAAPATFKMMLFPKGDSSFKKADCIGHVQLKCCSDLPQGPQPTTMISVSVGNGRAAQGPRGPFVHRFAASSVFGMPREHSDWDFGACVRNSSLAFTVTVEMASLA